MAHRMSPLPLLLLLACVGVPAVFAKFYGRLDNRPLFQYVNKPDDHYSYYDTGARINGTGWTGYVINMTSQQWMTPDVVSRSVWWHQLVIVVPEVLTHTNVSAIYVTGNGNDNPGIPSPTDEEMIVCGVLSVSTGTITAALYQIPNAPVVFADDPEKKERGEDAFVAFTWYEYVIHPDQPEWVDLLPMTKAVVRAMDTIQNFVQFKLGVGVVDYFAIAGGSKRGWTTWMTGIVDSRVIGIMPIVMDMLNFEANLRHMYRAYGGWTFAFSDYYAMNLTGWIGTSNLSMIAAIVDPLQYASYLTMPKLVLDATGDEFFMPDDDQYWWGQLPGETYRLMVQNAEHSMATGIISALVGATSFYESLVLQTARPKFDWSISPTDGSITVTSQQKPSVVIMNFATTFDDVRRDFRLIKGNNANDPCKFIPLGDVCLNPVLWAGETIAPSSSTNGTYTYVASQPLPPKGWRGFFLELHYPGPSDSEFILTTQVSIIPNTFPFPDCTTLPTGCYGVLV